MIEKIMDSETGAEMTLEELTNHIDYYEKIKQEIDRLEDSKAIARATIIKAFECTGMRRFDTPSNLRARVDTQVSRTIRYEEAANLLPEDTLNKLVHLSSNITLKVTAIKQSSDESDLQE